MSLPPVTETARPNAAVRVLPLAWQLAKARRGWMLLVIFFWTLIHTLPLAVGILFKGVFDALAGSATAFASPWSYLVLALVIDVGRIGALAGGIYAWSRYWAEVVLRMRRNILAQLLLAPGARYMADSPSESISRFRDDVEDIALYLEDWADFWGLALFAAGALLVMASIDARMTAFLLVPLLLTLALSQWLRPVIRRVRRSLREATGRVTDFIGEIFAAVMGVQASGRSQRVVEAFERLGETRRRAAIRDALLGELFKSINDNMVHVATGIILLIGAGAMQRGTFTVGDFALFVTFLPRLTATVSFFGSMLLQHRRTGVAFERLDALLGGVGPERVVANVDLHLEGPVPEFVDPRPERVPLATLRVEGMKVLHADGATAVEDASFSLRRGSFTVITGAVGSGKSSLVKALIGLIPRASGDVFWNEQRVDDPASFFVPPRSAYTGQVPRLFSDTLRENLAQGRRDADRALPAALRLAVLERDIETLDRGLDTEVGTRGVKLSGGQVQRSAAARMFMRDADLLVFDDLSSALDLETERALWERLAADRGDATCLVVSHRRPALERADHVIVMAKGRVITQGTLAEVTATHAELLP